MKTVIWKDSLAVGNSEIDAQHKIFIGIIEKTAKAIQAETDKHLIESLLVELLKFAEFHFCSEENMMMELGYPGLTDHRKEHERALTELRRRLFALNYDYIDFYNLESFLMQWFIDHSTGDDARLAEFLKRQPTKN